MIPPVGELVLAFACETVEDTEAQALLAPSAGPAPFVAGETMACRRIASVAMVRRVASRGGAAEVSLLALPKPEEAGTLLQERKIVGSFLAGIGQRRPQLVGFGTRSSDLRLLAQRAVVLGVPARGFLQMGSAGVPDYFVPGAACAPDLAELMAGRTFAPADVVPSLREIAQVCGIPEISASVVASDATDAAAPTVRACCRALTVYLLWLRMAYVSGQFDAVRYAEEQELLRQHLMQMADCEAYGFAETFLEAWDTLTTAAESIGR